MLISPQRANPCCQLQLTGLGSAWLLSTVWVLVAWLFSAMSAFAQTSTRDQSPAQSALAFERIEVLAGASSSLSLQDVLSGQGGAFVQQGTLRLFDPSYSASLWAKIYLRSAEPSLDQRMAALSILSLNRPYLNSAALYTPIWTATGWGWQIQKAGASYPPQQWSIASHAPGFVLPTQAELAQRPQAQRFVVLHIPHRLPASLEMRLLTATQVLAENQWAYLGIGLALGAMALVCVIMAVLSWLYRDPIYAWYGLYSLSVWLCCASYSGVAQRLLWPVGGDWPGTAALFWLLLAMACQLQFSRLVFLSSHEKKWPASISNALALACVVLGLLYVFGGHYWVIFYFLSLGLLLLCMMQAVVLMSMGWRQGNAMSKIWLLTYTPIFLMLIYRMLAGAALVRAENLVFSMPIYAFTLEVVLMGLVLMWFARKRQGVVERERALAVTDPLTGFVRADLFKSRFARSWERRQLAGQDLAVAYVQIQAMGSDALLAERMLLRCVRVLRSATRSQDVVARLGGNLLAITMPDISMGDDLAQRLSRIVALGLMPDLSDPRATVLQFRIAASTCKRFRGDTQDLDRQLRELLSYEKAWGNKPIRYLDDRRSSVITQRPGLDSGQLEDMWDAALAEEINSSQLPSNAAEPVRPAAQPKITIARFQRK